MYTHDDDYIMHIIYLMVRVVSGLDFHQEAQLEEQYLDSYTQGLFSVLPMYHMAVRHHFGNTFPCDECGKGIYFTYGQQDALGYSYFQSGAFFCKPCDLKVAQEEFGPWDDADEDDDIFDGQPTVDAWGNLILTSEDGQYQGYITHIEF